MFERAAGAAAPPLIREQLRGAAERLRLAGIAQPGREALAMWAALAGTTPGAVWAADDAPPAPELEARFRDAIARRVAGEPLAYAVGIAGFRTLDLLVDGRVLIPRPETEGLVDRVLAWARGRPCSALDLGTGSGCIALSLAVEGSCERLVATDLSADALTVARLNLERLAPTAALELRQGSWLEPVAGERFDVIVSNPPYLTTAEVAGLDPSVRAFEPAAALDGGADGLGPTRALLWSAGGYLAAGGLLALEIDCLRAAMVRSEALRAGWADARTERDLWGRERYLLASGGTA